MRNKTERICLVKQDLSNSALISIAGAALIALGYLPVHQVCPQ
jgi:hypothetical protein